MRGAAIPVQEDIGWSITERVGWSGPDLYVEAGFVQLPWGADVYASISSTDSNLLSRRVEGENERKDLYLSTKSAMDKFIKLVAESIEVLLLLNKGKVSKKD